MCEHHKSAGFHLLEILIVISIIGILSGWMITNYQTFFAKAKRHTAAASLYSLASALEEYAMIEGNYESATLARLHADEFVANHSYQLKIDDLDSQAFKISARPLAAQAQIDAACGNLILTSSGVKAVSGHKRLEECW